MINTDEKPGDKAHDEKKQMESVPLPAKKSRRELVKELKEFWED